MAAYRTVCDPESDVSLVVVSKCVCLQVDRDVTAQCSARLVPITMALFLKYSHGENTADSCNIICVAM